jgi:steroid 5-alpha reductase family enzyme
MTAILYAYVAMLVLVSVLWFVSLFKSNVTIVDSGWSILFLLAATLWFITADAAGTQHWVLYSLLLVWALRLSLYLVIRNWGKPEDRRYADIRSRYQPNYELKSLFIVFFFQASLAIVIALPVWAVMYSPGVMTWVSYAGAALFVTGFVIESVADWQLYRFTTSRGSKGKVLSTGLWKYTRHPNYFGEFLVWWGVFFFAVDTGAYWTIVSPLLMSFLLLRFSGVTLLEQTISDRRPEYSDYRKSTNAFFPWPPRSLEKSRDADSREVSL